MMRRRDLNGFAVDVGGTKTAVARIVAGEVVEKLVRPTNSAADLFATLLAIETMLTELGWRRDGSALGIAVTGQVSADGKWSAVNSGTLPAITEAPLGEALRRSFGPVRWSNDASATALAEYHFGAGRGTRNFAYVTVSTGVGGGFVCGGQVIESRGGLAGHVGFSTVRGAASRCGSGRTGTVESVASGRAIARAAAEAGHPGLDARKVFAAMQDGVVWATEIIDCSAAAVAELCANLTTLIDPDRIAIGGSVGLAHGYIERVDAHLSYEPELFRRPVKAASLGGDGPLLGALAHRGRQDTR